MIHFEFKRNYCQALIADDLKCMKRCVNDVCCLHGPEKQDKEKLLWKEIAVRRKKYMKYVEREVKKNNMRHRKAMERIDNRQKETIKLTFCNDTADESSLYASDNDTITPPAHSEDEDSNSLYHSESEESEKEDDMFVSNDSFESAVTTPEEDAPLRSWYGTAPPEEEPQDPKITALMKRYERERDQVVLRSYNGPPLDPFRLNKIKSIYESEMEKKIDVYNGLIKMLSCYTNTDEIDLKWASNEARISNSITEKETDKVVKIFATVRKTPLSAYR